jgi:DNA-binding transcriptional regulator/RsmH inhibitor MraZ
MFVGQYDGVIDRDRCVALPPAFLEELRGPGERRGLLALPRTDDGQVYLRLYRAGKTESGAARFAELDAEGRVWLPEDAVRRAGLGTRVTLLGNFDRIEIWDPARYEARSDEIDVERTLWPRPWER